jgi:hypothetical protein
MRVLCIKNSTADPGIPEEDCPKEGHTYTVLETVEHRNILGSNKWYVLKEINNIRLHHSSIFVEIKLAGNVAKELALQGIKQFEFILN